MALTVDDGLGDCAPPCGGTSASVLVGVFFKISKSTTLYIVHYILLEGAAITINSSKDAQTLGSIVTPYSRQRRFLSSCLQYAPLPSTSIKQRFLVYHQSHANVFARLESEGVGAPGSLPLRYSDIQDLPISSNLGRRRSGCQ